MAKRPQVDVIVTNITSKCVIGRRLRSEEERRSGVPFYPEVILGTVDEFGADFVATWGKGECLSVPDDIEWTRAGAA